MPRPPLPLARHAASPAQFLPAGLVYILRELVDLLCRERIVLPGDAIFQNMVRRELAFERKRLTGALEGSIAAEDAKFLGHIFADDAGLHQITTIQRQPRDLS
jgi:hypothetical protein